MRILKTITIAAMLTSAACSDPASDESPPIIPPVGNGPAVLQATVGVMTDTIDALSTFGVQVLDSAGFPAKNAAVVFSVLPDSTRAGIPVRIGAQSETTFGNVVMATTDANGKAFVRVLFGSRPGTSRIRAVAVASQNSLEVKYTTLIGQPARITLPIDTVIVIGQTIQFNSTTFDRDGNVRTERPTITAVSGPSLVTTDGATVTGVRTGLQAIEARLSANGRILIATSTIWILPADTLSSVSGVQLGGNVYDNIVLRDLTGRPSTPVSPKQALQLSSSWQPGQNRVVFEQFPRLRIKDPSGAEIDAGEGQWPEFSTDGQWIYFSSNVPDGFHIYRMRPDGTGREVVTPNDAGSAPTVSPDGNSVAFASGTSLRLIDMRTGIVRTIAQATPNGDIRSPRWSPDGKYVAYLDHNTFTVATYALTLVRPEIGPGSVVQTGISPLSGFSPSEGIAWSTDSEWMALAGVIVHVPTLQKHAVSTIGRFPSWKR